MKTAKVFLIGMYVHFLLSVAIPAGIFFFCQETGWNAAGIGLLAFYLLEIVVVHVLGWVTVSMAGTAYRRGEFEKLKSGWKLLKLSSIPFYILNFIYSFLVWFILVGASRGILIIFVPIPIIITCLLIVQSGCVGVLYIKYLRKQPGENGRPHGIHYLLQMVSVLDVISTLVILKKYARKA